MKKGKIAPLLCALLCALLCGCQQADEVQDAVPSPYSTAEPSPSPAAETEYGYPPAYGDMGEIMSRYSWGWTISEDTSFAYSSRQDSSLLPGSEKFQITEIVPVIDGEGGAGMVNMHCWPSRSLPDGTPERDVNLNFTIKQEDERIRRFCENDTPAAFAAAGDIIGDSQYAAGMADRAGEMLAGLEYGGVQTALLRGRSGNTYSLCEYSWSEAAEKYLFSSITILKSENFLAMQAEDFAGDFKDRNWPAEVVTVEEMESAAPGEGKFLAVGRLEGILSAGEGFYYSAFADILLGGTVYEAMLSDGAGEVKVRVLPTVLSEEELCAELLHVVSRSTENGKAVYTIESSALPAARYML